jgi:uncharacterized protein
MSLESDLLCGLVQQPDADPEKLVTLADAVYSQTLRGDAELGLLEPHALTAMVEAYQQAAKLGNLNAYVGLGNVYLRGFGVDYSPEQAAEAFAKAGEHGQRTMALQAARLWMQYNVLEHAERAIGLVNSLLDSDADGNAHLLLGYMTYRGFGVPKDQSKSFQLHEIAANSGNADAMFELYVLLSTGQGVPKDNKLSLVWCEKAAERNHPRALFNLGTFYATGNGVPQDSQRALSYYLRSSAAGNGKASAHAGVMYWQGEGTDVDQEKANEFFELAFEQGYDVDTFLDAIGIIQDEPTVVDKVPDGAFS